MPRHLIHTERAAQTDEWGAIVSRQVFALDDGFEVVTSRDFYDRRGSRTDYEFTTERFASREAALAAAGVQVAREAA